MRVSVKANTRSGLAETKTFNLSVKANTRSGLAETKTFNLSVKANTHSGLSGEAAAGTNTRTQQCATHPKRGKSSGQSDVAATYSKVP
jgi:hypothetical protein